MIEINGLAVPCPRCAARAGHSCWTSSGRRRPGPHRSRVKQAAEHQRADELLGEILREAAS